MTDAEFNAAIPMAEVRALAVAKLDARITLLEQQMRQRDQHIRNLYWSLTVVTVCLTIAIVCVALFMTGYLPR
jgi:hypothetical protein